MANGEVADVRRPRELVPGTKELAIVAAEDAVADSRPQVFRDRPLELDRQVGDAAARVELVRRDDGLRGAHVEASSTRPTALSDGDVWLERQIRIQLANQKPRAVAIEQVRMLADPAEAGVARERFLEHGCAVDEYAVAELAHV